MLSISILTFQNGYNRNACDFYPLIKWEKYLKKEGIFVQYVKSHEDRRLFNSDIVIIDHRYYRKLIVHENIYPDKGFVKDLADNLRNKGIKVILFDMGDGAGGNQWELIDHVDILVRKQLLRDKKKYTEGRGVNGYMVFLDHYDLNEIRAEKNRSYDYTSCPKDQLDKIKLGWNIGMLDYRYFPLKKFYPIGTARILNSTYKLPTFKTGISDKTIDSSFRGRINKENENYSFQRNKVIEYFQDNDDLNLVTGDFIPKRKYKSELNKSKTCVSPYGWGEVCYRDFEAIMAGAILIKPDMDHIVTYPDIYKKNKTYIPLKWDMSDLGEKIAYSIDNYEELKSLISTSRYIYLKALTDHTEFVRRFKNIIGIN